MLGEISTEKCMAFCPCHERAGVAKPNLAVSSTRCPKDYFIKTKFLGQISIEKCMAFCPYRVDGRFPGADKILLARALHNIPPEMSIEESLVQFRLPSFLIPFVFITSFQIGRNSARRLGLV
jgi:hypothetical protein